MEETTEQKETQYRRGHVIFFSVLSLVVGSVTGYFLPRPQASPPIVVSTPVPTRTPLPTPTPAPVRVHVSGEVLQPGVYELSPGGIVQDAIEAAGGPAPNADLDCINLALELKDQQKVYVPCQGEMAPPPPLSGGGPGNGGTAEMSPLNINTATTTELERLPGIGPTLAQRIVEYRQANGPFVTVEDIQEVCGIGRATFEDLKDLITVQ
jgi:competence protein ComEA